MILKAIAVDDEVLALHKIDRYCRQIDYIELIEKFDNPVDAYYFLNHQKVDLLFLDIQMDEFSGLELLNRLESKPYVILTTAYSQYSLKAFELDVVDYLLKPIRFERFKMATDRALERSRKVGKELYPERQTENNNDYLFVKSGRRMEKIILDDILYIEGMKDYLSINTYKKRYLVLMIFSKMLEILPEGRFSRVHRSYIVSLSRIESIKSNMVVINGKELPVSKTYRKTFSDQFRDFNQKRLNKS